MEQETKLKKEVSKIIIVNTLLDEISLSSQELSVACTIKEENEAKVLLNRLHNLENALYWYNKAQE